MHIMVHCKSCESYRLLKTALVSRDRFFEHLSCLPIKKFLKDFCHQFGQSIYLPIMSNPCWEPKHMRVKLQQY